MTTSHSFGYELEEVVENYTKHRPTYTSALFEKILTYLDDHHEIPLAPPAPSRDLAIDVGCGPGTSTVPLATSFRQVIGIDSSAPQIRAARKFSSGPEHSNVFYSVCSAEDMASIAGDETVDLVTVGTALHWFDTRRFAHECLRILKPGGVLAAYMHTPPHMENQRVNELIAEFIAEILQKYFEEHLSSFFNKYRETDQTLSEYFDQCFRDDTICTKSPYSIRDIIGFLKSTPQYFRYKADHPEHPDDVDRFVEKLKSVYATSSIDQKVDICHFTVILVAGRKPRKSQP